MYRLAVLGLCLCLLTGCGTTVPELREWPNYGEADTQNMIDAIVQSVRCELRNTVTLIVNHDLDESRKRLSGQTYSDFLSNWGAEVALTFTIVEKGSANPSALWTPASAVFTLAGGLSASSQATRVEKMNVFYTIKELYLLKGQTCDASHVKRYDSFLIQNDLKLKDLFYARMGLDETGLASAPFAKDKNVLSHEISFQVVTSGNITPAWKLVRVSVDPAGNLLTASRDRTHDLLITFGPIDRARGGLSLIAIAEQAHFSSQISAGVTNGFRSALPQ